MKKKLLFLILIGSASILSAQNLEDLLDRESEKPATEFTQATFKSVQLINAHTTKLPDKGELIFLIAHRFGNLDTGFPDLWGLDNATIRLGLEYGLSPTTSIGLGRSSYKSNYDFFVKQLFFRQSSGAQSIPLTLGILATTNISSDRWPDDFRNYLFAHRMSYSFQLLFARKFNRSISLQLMPTLIHRNLVPSQQDKNDVWALGSGGRFKLTNRVALTLEYHYVFRETDSANYENPLSIGLDIETGGHVFQLFFTNASAIYDAAFVTETTGKWLEGNIRFGFNITRSF
ncbi:MAG TPA: DUF5777 family beta-barrel protein [Prolixibacteraceae bacterium]|nr:DUF5777 family beta-barrel protein [Prolixibacteraceae bacterium]